MRRVSQRTPHQGQPAPSLLARVFGERCQLPQRGPGRSPGSQAVFSERVCCRPSVCRMSSVCRLYVCPSVCLSVCRLSVTLVHPIQAIVISAIFLRHALGTLATLLKISRRSSQGNPCAGELNTRGVVTYSDFRPIDGYISETVQDKRQVSINAPPDPLYSWWGWGWLPRVPPPQEPYPRSRPFVPRTSWPSFHAP